MKNKDIESFLWSQSVSPIDENWFIIDEHVSKYCQNEEQKRAMSFMTTSELKRKDKHRQGDTTSTGYEIKESKNAIQLSGNFCEIDESGRPLVYVFTTQNKNIQEAIDNLSKYAQLINCTLRKENIEAYLNYYASKKKRLLVATISGIIVIIVSCLIYLLA